MNKTFIIIQKVFESLFTSIFLIIFSWLLWQRFFVEKVPRTLPYEFSLYGYLGLFLICCTNIFLILYQKTRDTTGNLDRISPKIMRIKSQILAFDTWVKNYKTIKPMYQEYFLNLLHKLKSIPFSYLVISLQVVPRSLLVSVFFIEIFHNHYINYFYKIILIGLLPIAYNYIIFALNGVLDDTINKVDAKVTLYCFGLGLPATDNILSAKTLITVLAIKNLGLHNMDCHLIPNFDYLKEQRLKLNVPHNMTLNVEKFKQNTKGALTLGISIKKLLLLDKNYQQKYQKLFLSFRYIYITCTLYMLMLSFPLMKFSSFNPWY